jgi:antitoxin (DNA-binding transcriptional repressor) of toxin-antitoxin stability system
VETVNIYEAKSSFSRLISAAESGATIIIARNGRPVARLGPMPTRTPRSPGRMKGEIRIGEDFDDWTIQDEADWHGGNLEPSS